MTAGGAVEPDPEEAVPVLRRAEELPPLPRPKWEVIRQETFQGCAVVLGIVAACLLGVHGLALRIPGMSDELRWGFAVAIDLEAAIAVALLARLMLGDPGVIERTPENTAPVPPAVADRLADQIPVSDWGYMSNITDGDRSYCVRCMVWRGPVEQGSSACWTAAHPCGGTMGMHAGRPARAHHCSTCQRCVRDFDHHCGVLGRCIAGRGLSGNFWVFVSLITMAHIGWITALSAVVTAFAYRYGALLGFGIVGGAAAVMVLCNCVVLCAMRSMHWLNGQKRLRMREAARLRMHGAATDRRPSYIEVTEGEVEAFNLRGDGEAQDDLEIGDGSSDDAEVEAATAHTEPTWPGASELHANPESEPMVDLAIASDAL